MPIDIKLKDDTLKIPEATEFPVIPEKGNDNCWTDVNWKFIDMIWISWNGTVSPSDYAGKYKVVWSGAQNLLYFLAQITEDTIVDHYQPDVTSG